MDVFIRQMMKSIPAMIAQTGVKDKAKSEKEPKVESEDKKPAKELKLSLDTFFAQQFARLMVIVKGDASPLAMAELVKFDLGGRPRPAGPGPGMLRRGALRTALRRRAAGALRRRGPPPARDPLGWLAPSPS